MSRASPSFTRLGPIRKGQERTSSPTKKKIITRSYDDLIPSPGVTTTPVNEAISSVETPSNVVMNIANESILERTPSNEKLSISDVKSPAENVVEIGELIPSFLTQNSVNTENDESLVPPSPSKVEPESEPVLSLEPLESPASVIINTPEKVVDIPIEELASPLNTVKELGENISIPIKTKQNKYSYQENAVCTVTDNKFLFYLIVSIIVITTIIIIGLLGVNSQFQANLSQLGIQGSTRFILFVWVFAFFLFMLSAYNAEIDLASRNQNADENLTSKTIKSLFTIISILVITWFIVFYSSNSLTFTIVISSILVFFTLVFVIILFANHSSPVTLLLSLIFFIFSVYMLYFSIMTIQINNT